MPALPIAGLLGSPNQTRGARLNHTWGDAIEAYVPMSTVEPRPSLYSIPTRSRGAGNIVGSNPTVKKSREIAAATAMNTATTTAMTAAMTAAAAAAAVA